MRRRFSTRILLYLLLVISCLPAHAQNDEDSDTTILETLTDSAVSDESDQFNSEQSEPEIPVTMRKVPDSVVSNLKRSKTFEYANDREYWTKAEDRSTEGNQTPRRKSLGDYTHVFFAFKLVRVLFYILLGLLLLFIIYRIALVNNLYFSRRNRKLVENPEGIPGDIESDDPDERIRKAIAEKNHRLAVRYLYLKALKLLNDKGWIKFHAQATNYEYVNQVSKYSVASEFRFLTDAYDYVWYGEFELTPEQFELVNNNFKNFYQAIK